MVREISPLLAVSRCAMRQARWQARWTTLNTTTLNTKTAGLTETRFFRHSSG
jgi:hypothetical protein